MSDIKAALRMSTGTCDVCGFALRALPMEPGRAYCPGHGSVDCLQLGYHRLRSIETTLRSELAEARGLAWRLRRSVMVLASGSGDPALRSIFGAVWDAVRSDADMIPDTEEWRP